ncbi:hypothetical protein FM120_31415 [Sphingobacterium faecium PCAi_F2.5]|nr:hypothetical protein FM120_31415 [Sphingobacterium faecium PCAi_F2.5]
MAKKLKVVALAGLIHTITKQDLESYPHLVAEGIKVGDEVEVGNDVKFKDVIKSLEAENIQLKNDKDISDGALEVLKAQLTDLEESKNIQITALENTVYEVNQKLLGTTTGTVLDTPSKKVIVNHGVIVGGKKFTKEQIENDPSTQEVLLEMGSTAVTKIEG